MITITAENCDATSGVPHLATPTGRQSTREVDMPSRREFIAGVGAAAVGSAFSSRSNAAHSFKLSVLTDEISQDLGHACEVAARDLGLGWVELRAMHDKNVISWDTHDIAEARSILDRFTLQVSEIASPVFKADWPARRSPA